MGTLTKTLAKAVALPLRLALAVDDYFAGPERPVQPAAISIYGDEQTFGETSSRL